MTFYRIDIPKAAVFLTGEEIHHLLLKDIDLYKTALKRGKAFGRNESKKEQYAAKLSQEESQKLNDLMQ